MARFNGMLLVAGLFAACGGEGAHEGQPGSAGVAGTTPNASGAGSQSGGSGQTPGGSGGAAAVAGSGGRAGASSGAGMAGGGTGTGGNSSGGISGGGGMSSSAGAGGAGGGAVSTPEMLVPTAKAYCAAARTCCAKQSDPVHLDDCEAAFGKRDQTSQGLRRGTVTIDAADLAKCQAAYEAAAISCEENGVLDACAGIVHGKVAEGGACLLSQECAGTGPRVCVVTGGQDTPGVCKATPGGKVGDLCSLTCRPHEICSFTVYGVSDSSLTPCLESDGVFCSRDAVPAKCEAIHAIGASCENDDQCGFLGYCDSQASHTCKKRGQLNDACGTCIASLMCKDGKCQSPPLTVGGTCDGYSLGPY